jgi:hypothetical protein
LIYKEFIFCAFSRQSDKTLDFPSVERLALEISTKLSTENAGKAENPYKSRAWPAFAQFT